jgi:PAS domain S-box-containing protein
VGEPVDAIAKTSVGERLARLTEASRALRRELRSLHDERAMFVRVCQTAVEVGRFRFAWVGLVDLAGKVIVPAAEWGTGGGYLHALRIALDGEPSADGPTASAVRRQRADLCPDIAVDTRMTPWREAATARGFRSSGAFPFHRGGELVGVLNVYSSDIGFIDPVEQSLLEGVVEDVGFALDALDRDRAQRAMEVRLRQSESRHRMQFEVASDGIFLADASHRFLDVNPAGCAMLGYARDELLTMRIEDIVAPANLAAQAVQSRGAAGVSFFTERVLLRKDQTTVDVELHSVILPEGGLQSVTRDVSARKRKQAAEAAMERMLSLGRLAQGVGHEINNPLAYLTLSLELAKAKLAGSPEAANGGLQAALVNAQDGAARITHIVKALVAFGRGDAEVVKATALARVVEGAITLTANRLRHVAQVDVDIDARVLVRANEFQLAQVFVNLLLNAADAMEGLPSDAHRVRISSRLTEDDRVVVEVSDSGPGIAEDALARVFDPFFTTKDVGKGTGIGLSISRAILATFDGTLEAANGAHGGALFSVGLRTASAGPASVAPPSAQPARRLRVLVVDDEPLLGRMIEHTLDEHDVRVALSAASALDLCKREEFDAILCDVMMPIMSGAALRAELERHKPALVRRMIFMTGGAFTESASAFLEGLENRPLTKPFDAAELRAALAALVGGASD